jgi:hypothetical protein
VLLLGLGAAVGCSAYPTFKEVPINCSAEDQYEFDPNAVSTSVSCYGDPYTADASQSVAGGDGPCGSKSALVLRTSHYNDWGSGCNFYSFAAYDNATTKSIPRDEHTWEGLSFWARAGENTSKGFTISLSDANNTKIADGGNCKVYSVDGGTAGQIIVNLTDPNTGQSISGSATASRLPDECGNNRGNGYDFVMTVTSEWAFYTIPWEKFTQWAYPNRVPNPVLTETGTVAGTGLLTSKLFGLGIRPPKEAPFELWIDKLNFYRKKGAGGVDAAVGPVGSGGAPSATGGSTAGTGGATGGTGGSSGSTGNDGVACPLPANALITDFTYTAVDGGATDSVHFGDSTTLTGSTSVYPTSGSYPVTSDVTQGNWHISGNLGDYSGFGLNLDNCSRVDASAYRGIQFTISGSVPQGNIVTFGMGTLNDTITASWLIAHGDTAAKANDPGLCVPTSGTNKYNQPTCADAKKDIPVTATPTVQTILWTDFTGGKPEPGVTPKDIISIYWYFPPPAGAGTTTPTTYPVDITIDDLQFITP